MNKQTKMLPGEMKITVDFSNQIVRIVAGSPEGGEITMNLVATSALMVGITLRRYAEMLLTAEKTPCAQSGDVVK